MTLTSQLTEQDELAVASMVRDDDQRFRVNSAVYTNERLFDLELERIFCSTWVFVAHEARIPTGGDYVTTTIGRQPVIVTRGDEGSIHVLLNRCAHRGSVVCRQERGHANTFRCPYHGWIYANDGSLVGAAQRSGYPSDLGDWGLRLERAAAVAVYRGLIFATLNPNAPSFAERLAGVKRYIDLWCDRSPVASVLLPDGAHRYEYPANWKLQCENGVDGYHGNYVHESFAQLLDRTGERSVEDVMRRRNTVGGVNSAKGLPYGDGLLEREDGMLGTFDFSRQPAYLRQLAEVYGADRAQDILVQRNLFVFPNLFLFESHIRVVRPVQVALTYVDVYPTFLVGASDEINLARLHEHERFFGPAGFGAPDDVEIFVCTQSGVAATGMPWLEFSRGLHRETMNDAGELVGHSTDEAPQRSQYREWARLMSGACSRGD